MKNPTRIILLVIFVFTILTHLPASQLPIVAAQPAENQITVDNASQVVALALAEQSVAPLLNVMFTPEDIVRARPFSEAVDPSGTIIASAVLDDRASAISFSSFLDNSSFLTTPFFLGNYTKLAYSPAGSLTFIDDFGGTLLIQEPTGFFRPFLPPTGGAVRSFAYNQGGLLVIGQTDGSVSIMDASSLTILESFRIRNIPVATMSFSPDGLTLAIGYEDGALIVWDMLSATEKYRVLGDQYGLIALAFSPDGSVLASGGRDAIFRLWNAADGALLLAVEAHQDFITDIAFNPSGTLIATTSGSGDFENNLAIVWGLPGTVYLGQVAGPLPDVNAVQSTAVALDFDASSAESSNQLVRLLMAQGYLQSITYADYETGFLFVCPTNRDYLLAGIEDGIRSFSDIECAIEGEEVQCRATMTLNLGDQPLSLKPLIIMHFEDDLICEVEFDFSPETVTSDENASSD